MSDAAFAPADLPAGIDGVETALFDGEAVLFHEATSMLHRLGSVAAAVWLLADGDTTVEAMTGEIADAFARPEGEVTPLVHEALASLAAEGLLAGHEGQARVQLDPVDEVAADGTRIVIAPPDP